MAKKYNVIFPFLGSGVGGSHIATFRLGKYLKQFFGLESIVLCVEGSRIASEAALYGLDVASTGERPISRNNPFYDATKVAHRAGLLKRYGDHNTIVHTNDMEATQSWAPCAKLAGMKKKRAELAERAAAVVAGAVSGFAFHSHRAGPAVCLGGNAAADAG